MIGDVPGRFTMFNVDKQPESTTIVDKFVVAQQTLRCVKMTPGKVAPPIYCVASGHSLDMTYHWYSGVREVGTNSPVLWASGPGTFKCTITKGLRACASGLITVEGIVALINEIIVAVLS